MIKKVKNTVSWKYAINDFKGNEIVKKFYEKELQKINQKEFRSEKVIKRKSDKLYVKKQKGYNNSFNSWIDKKRHNINEWTFLKTKIFCEKCESLIRFV